MPPSDDNALARIRVLAARQLDDSLTTAEHDELQSLLLTSAAARRAYVEYYQDTASLRWLCLEELSGAIEPSKTAPTSREALRPRRRHWAFLVVGAAVCVVALATAAMLPRTGPTPTTAAPQADAPRVAQNQKKAGDSTHRAPPSVEPPAANARTQVATLTGLGAVRWTQPMPRARLLSRWSVGDRLQLAEGAIVLTFDAGAQVTIFGPADFEITSATSIRCQRGRVTALVGERGKGFVVQTPRARVVDLGTQFGLAISEKGETEVVVFQGSVDISHDSLTGDAKAPPRRLRQGEALLLNNAGQFERIVSIQRNDFLTALDAPRRRPPEPVIASVQDNIRPTAGVKSYQIVHHGLEDDAPSFVDRNHQWNGIDAEGLPPFLLGADYVMPFNDDKFVHSLKLQLKLLRPAYLYVFLDNNMEVPDWLRTDFEDTGVDIGMDGSKTVWHETHSVAIGGGKSIDFPFSVWRRHVTTPGTVTLGSVIPPKLRPRSSGFNMYGIAAVAAE